MTSSALTRTIKSVVDKLSTFATDLTRELVRIPSVTGDEERAQLHLAGRLTELGLEVDVWRPVREDVASHPAFSDDGLALGHRPVVVARWRASKPGSRSLILNGHIDVVPTGEPAAWIGGPWNGDVRDGRLWGRGSCDMKAGLAAAVTAVAVLQQMNVKPAGDVLIESVIGEETGGVGTLATLLRGYRADAALLLEPTRMNICPLGAGALSLRIHIRGRAAHGAMRMEGISAVEKFYRVMAALECLEKKRNGAFRHPLFDPAELAAPISVGRIEAGNWPSTVPESLVAEGRFGVLPGEDAASARSQFENAIRDDARMDAWLAAEPPEVEWFEGQFAPGETRSDAPILSELAESHAAVCGRPPRIHGVPYGSDLRLFTNHGAMDAVLYGPGDVRVAHSLNEFVPLDEVRHVTEVVARTIVNWCGVDG